MTFYLSMTLKSLLIWILIILILVLIAFIAGFCIGSDGQDEKGIRADERAKLLKEVDERFNSDLGSFGFWLYEQIEEVRNDTQK